jgi:hypothetical protein
MGIPSVSSARANMNFDAPMSDPVARRSCSSPGRQHCPITGTDNAIRISEKHSDPIFRIFERLHGQMGYGGI